MCMRFLIKVCDPSNSFLLGINSKRISKFKYDEKIGKKVKNGGYYKLSLGFLLFEIILIFNYDKI